MKEATYGDGSRWEEIGDLPALTTPSGWTLPWSLQDHKTLVGIKDALKSSGIALIGWDPFGRPFVLETDQLAPYAQDRIQFFASRHGLEKEEYAARVRRLKSGDCHIQCHSSKTNGQPCKNAKWAKAIGDFDGCYYCHAHAR